MGSVVELVVSKPTIHEDQPVQDLIDMLEDYTRRAKNGEIRAMAIVGVTNVGGVFTGTKTEYNGTHRFNLLGGLTVLTNRLSRE